MEGRSNDWPKRPLVFPDLMTPVEAAMSLRLDGIRELVENPRPDDTLVIGLPLAPRPAIPQGKNTIWDYELSRQLFAAENLQPNYNQEMHCL